MNTETEIFTKGVFPKIVFLLLLLISIHFWDLRYIPQKHNIENIFTWLICGGCFFLIDQKSKIQFKNAIFLFLFGLAVNVLASYINLDQNPVHSILSYSFYYFILIYFLLHYLKLSREYLENVIIIFACIYSALYVIQYSIYPYSLFKHDALTAQGGKQFEIIGHGFLMLAYFLMLNRFLLYRRLKSAIMASGFFLILLLCDFRTLIAGAILITVVMVFRTIKLSIRDFIIIIVLALMVLGLTQLQIVQNIFKESAAETENNFKEGTKYIRWIELEFFFKKYPHNFSYFIMGGGKASGDNLLRFNPEAMGMNYNIVWVDIGLLGFYIVIGAIATFGMLWYTFKAVFIKVPRDSYYLNFYFLYLFIVSFTNEEIYRNGIFTVQAIALYLIDLNVNMKSVSKDVYSEIEGDLSVNN